LGSRLAENPAVSEETIRADAKRAAISVLEQQENAREPSCCGANRGGAGEL